MIRKVQHPRELKEGEIGYVGGVWYGGNGQGLYTRLGGAVGGVVSESNIDSRLLTKANDAAAAAAAAQADVVTAQATADAAIPAPGTPEQGDVLYYNGTNWVSLLHGTAGQFLKTGGHAANPSWDTPSVSGVTGAQYGSAVCTDIDANSWTAISSGITVSTTTGAMTILTAGTYLIHFWGEANTDGKYTDLQLNSSTIYNVRGDANTGHASVLYTLAINDVVAIVEGTGSGDISDAGLVLIRIA